MRRKRKYDKRKKQGGFSLFLFSCLIVLSFLCFREFEKKFLPMLKEISHLQCKAMANHIIDDAVEKTLTDMGLSDAPLLIKETDTESYTVNTVLVNRFCTQLSETITTTLEYLPKEVIRIPAGAASGTVFFVDMGPKIPFTLLPMGAAHVDYETAFQSVGINQINYKIWLHISIDIKIVNPLYHEPLTLERKIMLADLIFSGKVPNQFFRMGQTEEYLLTE